MSASMAEVINEELDGVCAHHGPLDESVPGGCEECWVFANRVEERLAANGYGKLEEAKAAALVEAADTLDRLHRIGATRSDQCTPEEKADYRTYAEFNGGHSAWLRDRAEAERT